MTEVPQGESIPHEKFRYILEDPNVISEKVKGFVPRVLVPVCCFWGTQNLGEYDTRKEKKAKNLLWGGRDLFLIENPIISCAVPLNDVQYNQLIPGISYNLVILDGHHRVRFAPSQGVKKLFSDILTVKQATLIHGNKTAEEFVAMLNDWKDEAENTFFNANPRYQTPLAIRFERKGTSLFIVTARSA